MELETEEPVAMVLAVDKCPECSNNHLDLSSSAFAQIANPTAGIIDISIQPIRCPTKGNIVIRIDSGANPNYFAIFIQNVGGAGSVKLIEANGGSGWQKMTQLWGVNWVLNARTPGPVSLRVTASDGKQVTLNNCVPANWKAGSSYTCNGQFS
ncbi:hypothetical protein KFL_000120440 [Klebsormidium nitens]|uniref:Expansin n=1 Tax=Klebsormidium nitens TaxID=105231 RepID=A0A1Y1HIS8_KLENI|nr:hypothetical protein KFL_000120440 [Klebsormidium nitens]|eukprot:GAQ78404.1 hypothetical protein KFL_000120440 [Klebsormidium nitens]